MRSSNQFAEPDREGLGLGCGELKSHSQAAFGGVLQAYGPSIDLHKVTNDSETKTGAGGRFVRAHSALKDYVAHVWENARSVIVDENDDALLLPK